MSIDQAAQTLKEHIKLDPSKGYVAMKKSKNALEVHITGQWQHEQLKEWQGYSVTWRTGLSPTIAY